MSKNESGNYRKYRPYVLVAFGLVLVVATFVITRDLGRQQYPGLMPYPGRRSYRGMRPDLDQGQPVTLTPLSDDDRARLEAALKTFDLGDPVAADNLTVVPIVATGRAGPGEEYLTLEEAMKDGLVAVRELEGGGSVPVLEMGSRAKRPVFIPLGAIVTGGKQDRMVRGDVILKPGEKKQVFVFCVEQGRWADAGDGGVRESAKWGYFSSSKKCMSYGSRKGVANRANQSDVWAKVAETNRSMKNSSGSSNFRWRSRRTGSRRKQAFNVQLPAFKAAHAAS
jgi:hypothetical protein